MVYANGLRYFSGYIVHLLVKEHRKLGSNLNDCEKCSQLLAKPDSVFHLFVTFKQYRQHVSEGEGLKFCSKKFANVIDSYEKIFLYAYDNFKHEQNFGKMVINAITGHCEHPDLCSVSLKKFLVKKFVMVRTFHNVRLANRNAAVASFQSKLTKLSSSVSSSRLSLKQIKRF